MPIPSPDAFRRSTRPLQAFVRYGSNMELVATALEEYWAQRNAAPALQLRLLYQLWKVCAHWIETKSTKTHKNGELHMRRQLNVTLLQKECLIAMSELHPGIGQALEYHSARKSGRHVPNHLTPLSTGYGIERTWYVNKGKTTGATPSASRLEFELGPRHGSEKWRLGVRNRSFENLRAQDVDVLLKREIMGTNDMIAFFNKIERLRYLVVPRDGLFYDIQNELVLMDKQTRGTYWLWTYAMDQYGNIYTTADFGRRDVVMGGEVKTVSRFNHSSYLAGREVICAGCFHIGYDVVAGTLAPGVMSHIDNSSGHYKPNTEALRECVESLHAEGVDITRVRVGDWSLDPTNPRFFWGDEFLNGAQPWPDPEHPTRGVQPPPINPTI